MIKEGPRMRMIEESLFKNYVKRDIVEETGVSWNGGFLQQRMADLRVANAVRSSLASYEKTLKPGGDSFFRLK